jgi:hypothetical protein
MRHRAPWLLAVLAAAAVYAAAGWYLSEPATFWSSDSAVRFVQAESLRSQGYRTLAVLYPAEDVDPDHDFYPVAEGFSYRRGGRTYLSYPWFFPALAAPFYGALGFPGLLVVPAVAGLAAAAATGTAVGRGGGPAGAAVVLLVGVASPLLVYGAVFWDHTVVAALAAGGCALLLGEPAERDPRRRAFWAGALLGLGPWFRNETYVLFVAGVGGLVVSGRVERVLPLCRGFAVAVLPLWAYHLWWFGNPLGYKGRAVLEAAVAPGALNYVQQRVLVAYDLLLSVEHYTQAFRPRRLSEAALLASGVVAGSALLRAGLDRGSRVLVGLGGAVLAAVGTAVVAFRIPVMGLLPSVPWVGLAALRQPREADDRFLWTVAGLYVAGVAAVGSVGGLQWGPRYLMPAVPVLGVLCGRWFAEAWRQHPALRGTLAAVVAGLVLSGLAVQVLGVRFIRHSLDTLRAIQDVLAGTRYEVVATGHEPMFRALGGLYFRKKLLAVDSQQELRRLVDSLARRRVTGWTYVPRFAATFDARLVERWTAHGPWRFRVEEDRTPLVVEFGGPWPIRLITYRGAAGR